MPSLTLPANADPRDPAALAQVGAALVAGSRSPSTLRAYDRAWRRFMAFCADRSMDPVPTETAMLAFVSDLACDGYKAPYINQMVAGIGYHAELRGLPFEGRARGVRDALVGYRRLTGYTPARRRALTTDELRAMAWHVRRSPRDRALILFGFASAMRCSETLAMRLRDLTIGEQGATLFIPRSKTDQDAHGQTIAVARQPDSIYCPVRALEDWIARAGLTQPTDLVFPMDPTTFRRIVKGAAIAAGLDPERVSTHSLRAGWATSAADAGLGLTDIMRQTRHRDVDVAASYVRHTEVWRNPPSAAVQL